MNIEADPLTVVTLNTWKGAGAYAERLALMARELAGLDADLVLLQEVFAVASRGVNTGKVLADALGLHHVHAPARAKPRPFEGEMADSTSGLSILSRVPLSRVRVIDLPSTPADGERIALTGRLTWTDTLLTVAVVHFTYLPGAASLRLRQTETLVEALPPDIDTIIGGDFNAEPGSSALSWLRELPERTVTDAWDVAGGPQPTLVDRETETLSAGCVDHVMLIRPAVGSRLTLSAARRVLDTADPVSGLRPSDHAGLLAKLRVA